MVKKISVAVVVFALWLSALSTGRAAAPAAPAAPASYNFAKPKLVTGTLYAIGSDRKQVVYTFRRTATRSGDAVHVERQFLTTNGTVAAVEKILYENNQLVSYKMHDFQARISGVIRIEPDLKDPGRRKLFISYTHGHHAAKDRIRTLKPDTLIDDTLYPFMLDHWAELMQGRAVTFRFVSLNWERTFKFELRKTGASVQNGRPVVQITMKPASFFLAMFVKPIRCTVQQDSPHKILSYVGRTTPRVRKGKSWKVLDAVTVFHYPPD